MKNEIPDLREYKNIAIMQGITHDDLVDEIIDLTAKTESFTKAIEIQRERILKNNGTLHGIEKN